MKTLFIILFLIGVPLMILSCCSTKEQPKPSPYQGMSLIAATAGGFSGMSTGIKINYSGECYSWGKRLTKETEYFLFKASPDSIESLFAKFSQSGLDSSTINTAANVVNLLEIRRDSVIHQITWAQTDSTISPKIMELYQSLRTFTERNMKNK